MVRLIAAVALIWTLGSVAAPTRASEPRPLLLVDDSIKSLSALGQTAGFGTRELRPANGFAWEPARRGVGEQVGEMLLATLLMGPNGAAMVSGQQMAEIQAARRQWVAPLTNLVNEDDAFKDRMVAALRSALAEGGYVVGRVVISPDAKGAVLPRAAKDEKQAVVIRPEFMTLVGLTPDDRRVVFNARIEFYERRVDRFRVTTERKVRYASAPMKAEGAVEAWAQDAARPFWDELERGISLAVREAMDPTAPPEEIGEDEVATLATQVIGERFAGRVTRREGDLVWVLEKDGAVTVVNDAPWMASSAP